jgi:hypothetical protein
MKKIKKLPVLVRHYSGEKSSGFWKRIHDLNASPGKHLAHNILYQMGCALQDLEERMLLALADIEEAISQ